MPARIMDVSVVPDTYAIVLIWENGQRFIKNMWPLIRNQKIFAPLEDKSIFQQVSVVDDGRALAWPGDIDYCADALWAESQMTSRSQDEPLTQIA